MEKKRNTLLIVIIIMFVLLFIPWGDIHTAVFDTAKSQEDVIRIAERELKAHEDEEISVIGSFGYDGAFEGKYASKQAYWMQYGEKIALVEFAKDGEKLIYDGYHKPMKRGNDCYSEVLFNGYTFMSTNEDLATFVINGEKISADKLPFVYYYEYDIPEDAENGYTTTTEYYFLDKQGKEL